MTKCYGLIAILTGIASLLCAETNAMIEVKLFKEWIIRNENSFSAIAIKNTGTEPLLLAKDTFEFYVSQLSTRSLDNKLGQPTGGVTSYDEAYEDIELWSEYGFEALPVGETRAFDGQKFLLPARAPFAETMRYKVWVYLGKGFWLDSEPLTVHGVVPDVVEQLPTVKDNTRNLQDAPRELAAVTYKNERWLYYAKYYPVCPLSLTGKIRVEPHDGAGLFKIWDGDKPMIFDMFRGGVIVEGPDENDVLGKWTRERKRKADADNAEVRRRKADGKGK